MQVPRVAVVLGTDLVVNVVVLVAVVLVIVAAPVCGVGVVTDFDFVRNNLF